MAVRRGNPRVSITADADGVGRATRQAEKDLDRLEKSGQKSLSGLKKAALVTGAAVTSGLAVGLGSAVKAAADFEAQLDSLAAVSNASGAQMDRLKKQAMDAGAATKFSALEAAQAQTELAKGGVQLDTILRGGLKGALSLAAAGEMELADAAATTANALNLFKLRGKDAGHVADVLATAANATTADVSDFALALQQGGAAAKAAGLDLDQTVVGLEALAAAGVKGSDAGTSLKAAITQLSAPTAKQLGLQDELNLKFFDASGQMKDLSDISRMLRDRLAGMTKEQKLQVASTLAGTDGMRAFLALVDAGPKKLEQYERGLGKQGTAAEVAAKKQDNLKGKLENFQGSIETLGISVGNKLLPALSDAAETLTAFVNGMQSGTGAGGRVAGVVSDLAGAAAGAARGFGDLVRGFQDGAGGARLLAAGLGAVAAGFVTFKAIAVGAAAVSALRAAWVGLTAAMATNPIAVLAVAAGALIGALGILTIKTRENEVSSRAFNDALRAQRDAMREVQGIELDEAQRKANLRSATVAVEQAERNLTQARKEHGKKSLEAKQAEADLRQARVSQRRASLDLANAEDDAKQKRRDLKDATRDLNGEEKKLNGSIDDSIDKKKQQIRGLEESIDRLKREAVQNDATRGSVKKLTDRVTDLKDEINGLRSKKVDVSVRFKLTPSAGSVFGSGGVGDGVGRSVGKLAQSAADSGRLLPVGPSNLMGADPDLAPFAAIAAGMGLTTSSGLRAGAITSSGNRSYHASGDALDESGSPAAMMRYFQTMRSMFGSRLRELIYTPGGVGIKDGQPYRYSGQVAQDHYDHVHVAFTGPFGDGVGRVGDGLGKFTATSYGPPWGGINGTGVTATGVNLKSGPRRYGVAVDPSVIRLGSKVRISPNPFGYQGAFTAFDTGGAIKGRRIDFYDWRGRKAQLNWGTRTVTVSTLADSPQGSRGGNTNLGGGGSGTAGHTGANTSAGEGDTRPGGGLGFEGRLARNEVAQARAERNDNLGGLIKALEGERRLKRRRLRRINRLLQRRLKRATRTQLLHEKAQLIREIGELNETIGEYKADRAGGATTISRADELDAGVDTSVDGSSGGGGGSVDGPSAPTVDTGAADVAAAINRMVDFNEWLVNTQGPTLIAQMVAAVNGGIGGPVGLGFQGIRSPAGSMANL